MTKKLLALLMALVMCLSLVPFTVVTATAATDVIDIYWGIEGGTLYLGASAADITEKNATVGTPNVNGNCTYGTTGTAIMPWYASRTDITAVEVVSSIAPKYTAFWFAELSNLTTASMSNLKTGSVTNMNGMFNGCSALTSLDLSGWKTDSVTTMNQMFRDCSALTELNLSEWNTAKVTEIAGMFFNCKALISVGDISQWNTANVENMNTMFAGCASLISLDLSDWNTASVNNVASMFNGCAKLTELDLSDWDLPKIKQQSYANNVFAGCTALTTIETPKSVKEGINIALPTLSDSTAWWSDGTATYTDLSEATSTTLRPCHEITVNSTTNGSVSVQKKYAASGTNVTVTAVLSSGYQLESLKYNDGTDHDITVARSFTMPNVKVTVTATFAPCTYTITYKDKDGADFSGTHEEGYPTTHTYDAVTNLKSATKSGYTFGGWFTNSNCTGTAVTSLGAEDYTTATTLYAKWTKNSSGRSGGAVTTVVNMPLIRTGNRGDSVKELQTKLNALGYDCGTVDGIFGSKTYAAVVAFQKAMGIGVDGIVGPETWGKLGVTGIIVTTAPAAATSAVNLTISSNMPLITKGSTGDAVKALQTKLNALGYDCGKVDGIFGDKTLAAVKAYQTDKALLVDGKVGNQTWGALR